jgi:putative flippase GtrA
MGNDNGMRGQALRFLLVGGANTLATYAIFIVLGLFMPAWIAYTIAFAIGLAWVVFGSSKFVFRGEHGRRRLLLFAGWYLVIYAIGRVIIALIAPTDFVDLAITSLAVLVVTTPLTFIGGRFIFAPRNDPRPPTAS